MFKDKALRDTHINAKMSRNYLENAMALKRKPFSNLFANHMQHRNNVN